MAARNSLESQPLSGNTALAKSARFGSSCAAILRWHRAAMRTLVGRSAYSWRITETRVRAGGIDGLQVHDPTPRMAIADPAGILAQSCGCYCRDPETFSSFQRAG